MAWEIEYTDALGAWWATLTEAEQESVAASVALLETRGPSLGYPHTSGIATSRHDHMRELRVPHEERPYRVLYAFDPRQVGLLLIGGDKTDDDHWYEHFVPVADALYDEHLSALQGRGLG